MKTQEITTQYGKLALVEADLYGENCWTTGFLHKSTFYGQEISVDVSIFSEKEGVSVETIHFSEKIIAEMDFYLQKAIGFIQKSFTENPDSYKITNEDALLLKNPPNRWLTLTSPAFSFYESDSEWILRFDEGELSVCEPYGIAVFFLNETPDLVDTLDEAEEIG